MRVMTLEVAFDRTAWTPERAAEVSAMFDQLASEWRLRARAERLVPLVDALDRGGPFSEGVAVDLGSGIGLATHALVDRFPQLIAIDISMEMLLLAPPKIPRIRADASQLPLASGSVGILVLVNMLLFPVEVERVLSNDGALIWVNTLGPYTPIHLTADQIDAALPGKWDVVASEAGWGTWCVARRAGQRLTVSGVQGHQELLVGFTALQPSRPTCMLVTWAHLIGAVNAHHQHRRR
jgi:hypothetical protein